MAMLGFLLEGINCKMQIERSNKSPHRVLLGSCRVGVVWWCAELYCK